MFKVFAATIFTLVLSSFAQAQEATPAPHVGSGPCAADAAKFCAGIEHGDGRIAKCLHQNKDKVSEECKASKKKMRAAVMEVKEACHDDLEKFCSTVKAGGGRIMKCMKEHKEELSQGCKAEVEQMKEERKSRRGR